MASDWDLQRAGKQAHDLRHCDMEGCCTGVIIGKCRRCGFLVSVGTECPATKDMQPVIGYVVTMGAVETLTSTRTP